jgi:lipid A 3-O-deacylase
VGEEILRFDVGPKVTMMSIRSAQAATAKPDRNHSHGRRIVVSLLVPVAVDGGGGAGTGWPDRPPFRSRQQQGPHVISRTSRHGAASAILVALSLTAVTAPVHAQDTPPTEPAPDPATIVTLQTENDVVGRTDRNYTAGLRLGVTLPDGVMPDFLHDAGHWLLGEGRERIAIDLSQTLFTPKDTQLVVPNPNDRPYAAVLTGQVKLVHDTSQSRTILGIALGVLGPDAQGEELQNGFHNLIGEPTAKGWDYQIKNMPVVQFAATRIWRFGILEDVLPVIEMDVLPSVSGAVGTWRDYAQVGAQLRLGQGLKTDFGTSRISPGLTGADAYTPTRDFVWYVFAGADGQAVAWDSTLDGNPFQSGPHVPREPFVGEMELGFALIWSGIRFSYTHVLQTQEFRGQRGGLFQFGSFTIAARF